MLAHGFARVRFESGKDELLVAFSCKGRGVCPSCHAKRAQVTAVHWVERVLPHVPCRKWTLSFAHRVRLDRWSQPPVLPIALLKREMAVAGWRFVHSRYEGHRLGFMEKNGYTVQQLFPASKSGAPCQ